MTREADFSRGLTVHIKIHNGHPKNSDEAIGAELKTHIAARQAEDAWRHMLRQLEHLLNYPHEDQEATEERGSNRGTLSHMEDAPPNTQEES